MNYPSFRHKLLAQLPDNCVALIASGTESLRNNDVDFPFRAHSDFLYLTGLNEPDCVLVLQKLAGKTMETLFLRVKDPEMETWEGRRLGVEAAPTALGLNQAFAIGELDSKMPEILSGIEQVFFSFSNLDFWAPKVTPWLKNMKAQIRKGVATPSNLADLDLILHEMRLHKTAEEIEIIRQACQVSVQGHLAAMKAAKSAKFEYQIQSAIEHEFKMLGAERVAFNTIAAGGENACILHYTNNDAKLNSEDLILIDAGAELQGYAGDISHTFPLSGKFSPEQKALYEIVLAAKNAAIEVAVPGNKYEQIHQAAVQVLVQGLIDLEILTGDLENLIESGAYREFYMHGTGHFLGRDVHDVGRYKQQDQSITLQPGLVVTIEPGLYIPFGSSADKKWQGIGIRIEDDVLITKTGNEILTLGLPRTPAEIEAYMEKL